MPYLFPLSATFARYDIEDTGIRLYFTIATPGAGMPTDLGIFITDAELAGVVTQAQLIALVDAKLSRTLRAANIGAKLDPFIGQSRMVT